MSNICIIPARGGSKRIVRKNIKLFLGKPILAYSIEAALSSKLFDEIIVSTEDYEIADIARNYGANVPFYRSDKASDDFSTTFDVIDEVLSRYQKLKISFDNVCCLYPCAPLVTSHKLKLAFEILVNKDYESMIPVVPYSFPIQRSFIVTDNKLLYKFPEFEQARSQDLEKTYHDAGQFYWCKVKSILKNRRIINQNTGFLELNEMEVQDIDNEADWDMAELKYKVLIQ